MRAQLQNGTTALSTPFRPNYLQNDEVLDVGGKLPSFGRGSVRHVGHSRRLLQAHHTEESPGPDMGQHEQQASHGLEIRMESSRERRATHSHKAAANFVTTRTNDSPGDPNGRSQGKRKAAGADAEDQLVEANRKGLLKRQDWAGLAPSRPVNMHFPSRRDKHRIRKRRKVGGNRVVRLEKRAKDTPQHFRHVGVNLGLHMGEIIQGNEDIRIRIGTGALTNQTSTQRISRSQEGSRSHEGGLCQAESLDPMLFDTHEEMNSAEFPNTTDRRSRSHTPHPRVTSPQEGETQQPGIQRPHQRNYSCPAGIHPESCKERSATQFDRTPHHHAQIHALADAGFRKGNIGFDFPIMQHVGGATGPFRLVFKEPSEISDPSVYDLLHGNTEGFTHKNAGLTSSGRGDNVGSNGHGTLSTGEGFAHPSPIVDDAPWKAFVAITDRSSSHSTTLNSCRTPSTSFYPKRLEMEDNADVEPNAESQGATLGNRTRFSTSSCASASLPSLEQANQDNAPGRRPQDLAVRVEKRASRSHGVSEGEELWKKFVFESDGTFASEACSESVGERRTSVTACREGRSRVAPSPLASPFSSKLFSTRSKLVSREAVYGSDNIQDAEYDASLSALSSPTRMNVSQSITSSEAALYSEEYAQCETFTGHEGISDVESLQNNLHNTDIGLSLLSGDSKKSRNGLDRRAGTTRECVGTSQGKRSEGVSLRQSSIDCIPTSDDLDLVNPYRLT